MDTVYLDGWKKMDQAGQLDWIERTGPRGVALDECWLLYTVGGSGG
jgi:hypothetical protein